MEGDDGTGRVERITALLRSLETEITALIRENEELKLHVVPQHGRPTFGSPIVTRQTHGRKGGFSAHIGATIKDVKHKFVSALQDARTGETKFPWKIEQTFSLHTDGVWEVSTCPYSNLLASASVDRTVRLWDTTSKPPKCVHTYTEHGGSVNSARFHPRVPLIVTGVLSLIVPLLPFLTITLACGDGLCRVWKIGEDMLERKQSEVDTTANFDGGMLGPQSYREHVNVSAGSTDTHIERDANEREKYNDFDEGMDESVSTEERRDFSSFRDLLSVSEKTDNEPLLTLKGHSSVVSAAEFHSMTDRVVSSSWDKTCKLWKVTESSIVAEDSVSLNNIVTNVSCHRYGPFFLSSCLDSSFYMWDMRAPSKNSGASVSCDAHSQCVNSAVFLPNGASDFVVVSGSDDRTVKLWDMRNPSVPTGSYHFSSRVNRLAVCPAHNFMCVPLDRHKAKVLSPSLQGQSVGVLEDPQNGHTLSVTSCCWSTDGKTVYTASFDSNVISWIRSTEAM